MSPFANKAFDVSLFADEVVALMPSEYLLQQIVSMLMLCGWCFVSMFCVVIYAIRPCVGGAC